MRKLQLRRGPKADLPTLAEGEPGFVLDEGKLYVGTGAENVEFSRADHTHSEFDPAGSAATVEASLSAHTENKNNPHGVTAAQVGAAEANHTHSEFDPAGSAATVEASLSAHTDDKNNPHGVTAAQVGAAAAEHSHAQYAPLASPAFTGTPKAPAAATDYATYRLRNMALMSSAPSGAIGNGQLVGVYE